MLKHQVGFFSYNEMERIRSLFNYDEGKCGILVNANINVPSWDQIPVTIESDKYANLASMLNAFSSVILSAYLEKGHEC